MFIGLRTKYTKKPLLILSKQGLKEGLFIDKKRSHWLRSLIAVLFLFSGSLEYQGISPQHCFLILKVSEYQGKVW